MKIRRSYTFLWLRKKAKQILVAFLTVLLKIYAFSTKKAYEKSQVKAIALPFLPNLGIGDLIMLSPVIERIAQHFKNSEIHLLTNHTAFIQFPSNVIFLEPQKAASQYDLLLSISPHLKHAKYIFRSKMWYGYFFSTQTMGNLIDMEYPKCDIHSSHHINKGCLILKEKQLFGKQFELFPTHINYPILNQELNSSRNISSPYLAIGIFPQFRQSEWSLSKFAYIINQLFQQELFSELVILGGKSEREQNLNEAFKSFLTISPHKIIDLVGKTTLAEATSITSKSKAFLGIDSGLAHIAYLVAPTNFVIFTITHPDYRLPLNAHLRSKILAFHPYTNGEIPIFDGQHPLSEVQISTIGERLGEQEITQKIVEKLKYY